MDTGKWSEWFPPVSKPKSLDLDVINKERPDDVCLNSIASELRFVNSQPQIRFICPAGEILSNDFPPACMDRGRWTSWFDHSNPSGHDGDDIEELKVLNRERPGEICDNPLFMQVCSNILSQKLTILLRHSQQMKFQRAKQATYSQSLILEEVLSAEAHIKSETNVKTTECDFFVLKAQSIQ